MGNKQSSSNIKTQQQHGSTPSLAYGRLSNSVRSPVHHKGLHHHHHHHHHHNIDDGGVATGTGTGSNNLHKPSSLTNIVPLGEQQPLLLADNVRKLETLVSSESMVSTVVAPPLIVWIGPALLCALAYALYNIFIKKGSATIHPILGGVILQFVAAILGSVLLAFIVIRQHYESSGGAGMNIDNIDDSIIDEGLYYDAMGVKWAVCAGIAVGAAEILSFFVSSLGVQAMQSIPIIIGGSVMFGTVLGFVLLKEVLSYRGWIGVLMISAGISLVGLDPAATMAH